jgi:hypothetical protein
MDPFFRWLLEQTEKSHFIDEITKKIVYHAICEGLEIQDILARLVKVDWATILESERERQTKTEEE